MKNGYIFGPLLALAIVPAAVGNTIIAFQTPGASFSDSGEFTVVTTPSVLLGRPAPSGAPGFQTFCLESEIPFTPEVAYRYTLEQTDHSGNALTLGTAWLFSQFSAGTLPGYNYSLGAGRISSAANLQAAIYILQGQAVPDSFIGLGAADVALAAAATSGKEFSPSFGAFDVYVLNVNSPNGSEPAQDMLGVTVSLNTEVPDSGKTIALLGFALLGVAGISRKRAGALEAPSHSH